MMKVCLGIVAVIVALFGFHFFFRAGPVLASDHPGFAAADLAGAFYCLTAVALLAGVIHVIHQLDRLHARLDVPDLKDRPLYIPQQQHAAFEASLRRSLIPDP